MPAIMEQERFIACGTGATLTVHGMDGRAARAVLAEARALCERFEAELSRFLPASDISRLNGAGGRRVAIGRAAYEVLEAARWASALSGGAFDATTAPLSSLWDFKEGAIPDASLLSAAAAHVGWQGLEVGREGDGWYARLADPEAAVDAGGIAKGWIADRAAELLVRHGAVGYLVDLGGDIRAGGRKPDGSPWRIGIRDPRDGGRTILAVELDGGGIVTSGTYERSFIRRGVRYHHVLDPATGMPFPCRWASATVVAADAATAEAVSTAALILGAPFAHRALAEVPAVSAIYLVGDDGAVEPILR